MTANTFAKRYNRLIEKITSSFLFKKSKSSLTTKDFNKNKPTAGGKTCGKDKT